MAWNERAEQPQVRQQTTHDVVGTASTPAGTDTSAADHNWSTVDLFGPGSAGLSVGEWVALWLPGIDVRAATESRYRSALRRHILPRWAQTPLVEITNEKVQCWAEKLHGEHGLSPASVDTIVRVLSFVLADAVAYCHLPSNPIRQFSWRRRAAVGSGKPQYRTPSEVLQIADQVAVLYGSAGALLIVTAAWTGARWSELAALRRPNLHLFDDDSGYLRVDPIDGVLYESGSQLWHGPPKTTESARAITVPPFLVRLLRAHLSTHDHPHVFTTPENALHRRSAFRRRALSRATEGNSDTQRIRIWLGATKPGLSFHEFRRSHRAWMVEDGVAPTTRCCRLGEKPPLTNSPTWPSGNPMLDTDLLAALQSRWNDAVESMPVASHSEWRYVGRS